MYYPCSENKGADHRGYCEADLRLCFRLCRLLVFQSGGSNAVAGQHSANKNLEVVNIDPASKILTAEGSLGSKPTLASKFWPVHGIRVLR